MPGKCQIRVSFHLPSPDLRQYFTAFYLLEADIANNGTVEDLVHPEWGGVRLIDGTLPEGELLAGNAFGNIANMAVGPTSATARYRIGTCRIWGFDLLPLGWAKFVSKPANDFANTVCDLTTKDGFADFVPLTKGLFGKKPAPQTELQRIENHFLKRLDRPCPDEERIARLHNNLVDPNIANVHDLTEASGIKSHTLERLCRRYFGFTPRLLLRRQRFMRSVAQYILDPTQKWVGAMDHHYHDQAQFVRDFHDFMGLSPREYAAMPHPILDAMIRARTETTGAAVQALHPPAPIA